MALDPPRHPFLNRIDRRFTTDDINVPPRRFYYRRVDRRLQVGDIEGTAPGRQHRAPWPRCVDPLHPIYRLASFTHAPPEPMRFTRDTLDVSDIEGTRTTVPIVLRMRTRDHINYDDVPGSVAAHAQARRAARPVRPIMMVADINDGGRFRSRRHTDPLSPRYVLDGADASGLSTEPASGGVVIGDVPGSHPKRIRARPVPTFALATRDIDGNEPMWRVHRQQRLAVRATNATADIDGAQADTAGRWHWVRRTNPLAPDYQPLDRGDPPLNPLAAPNIGLDLALDDEDDDENRSWRSAPNDPNTDKEPVPGRRTRPEPLTMMPLTHGRHGTASSRCPAPSKKALSQRQRRERQERAHDQALVKSLPIL